MRKSFVRIAMAIAGPAIAIAILASCWAGDSSKGLKRTQSDSATDFSLITVACGSHIEALAIDPKNRKTGFHAVTGRSYDDIPNSIYAERYIESPRGLRGPHVDYLYIEEPAIGDYRLTVYWVYDSLDSSYPAGGIEISCYCPDHEPDSRDWWFPEGPLAEGSVYSFVIRFDKSPGGKNSVTGGFNGGGESELTDRLLSYANITESKTRLPSGTDSTEVFVIYGPEIDPATFTATLNDKDISELFAPKADSYDFVTLNLVIGENVLVLSIEGNTSDGRKQDKDILKFTVK